LTRAEKGIYASYAHQEIVKKEGFPGLLAKMEEKVKELANQPS
jgi:hypothetical protein